MPQTDFEGLIAKYSKLPDKMLEAGKKKALKLAEELAGRQRMNCPVDSDALRELIETFIEIDGDIITAGTRANTEYGAYVEFGTGPVGDRAGHPLDDALGITRKQEGWKVNIPGVGVRYTQGQPAQPFMYTGMKEMEDTIKQETGSVVTEAVKMK